MCLRLRQLQLQAHLHLPLLLQQPVHLVINSIVLDLALLFMDFLFPLTTTTSPSLHLLMDSLERPNALLDLQHHTNSFKPHPSRPPLLLFLLMRLQDPSRTLWTLLLPPSTTISLDLPNVAVLMLTALQLHILFFNLLLTTITMVVVNNQLPLLLLPLSLVAPMSITLQQINH